MFGFVEKRKMFGTLWYLDLRVIAVVLIGFSIANTANSSFK